uniref:Cytochrome c biogenesis protein CcsA n=1 Tax=Porolithon onkodes TaxID=231751 RepID=A0A2Z2KXS1_9FLOR|nr:c-type cytochrome synthesis protein [Porolithon onkodes]ASB29795.1 c-type cytochrome synthesis protein [Porolithon onkodes]
MSWHSFENVFINISFGLLLTSLLSYWISLAYPKLKHFNYVGKFCIILTNFCLFITLLERWIINQYFPLSNLYESLLFLTWCLTFTQIIIEYKNKNIIIGTINSPIALFIISFASFSLPIDMQEASPLVPALRSNWLIMHVTIMMVSYATLMLGSLLSIVFLVIAGSQIDKHKIKKLNISNNGKNTLIINNKNNITKITLLESIDNLSYRTIGLGFPLLTIGIVAGAVWANEAWGSYWSWDPKETWALITWLIFASYLHSRLTKSWSGKKPAILASLGFLVVWICYLGVNFLGKGLHSYGWLQ